MRNNNKAMLRALLIFDYIVYAVRKGYEHHQVIQPKQGKAIDTNK